MRFRPIKHIGVPYKKQVMIYATCLNYHSQPQEVRDRIDRLCRDICNDTAEAAALRDLLISGGNPEVIALEHHVTVPTLYRRRAKFYKRF